MINEKYKVFKDLLTIFLIIIIILISSYLINAFKFSFDSVNNFELTSSYFTEERKEEYKKFEVINGETGRIITFKNSISERIYYFDYIFNKESGIASVSFINDIDEARDYYIIKGGLYDSLDRIYYYSL